MMRRFMSICGIVFFGSFCSIAQTYRVPGAWRQIEYDLAEKKNLADLTERVSKYKQEAILANDTLAIARCFANQIAIADKKTEDSLFFKNSLVLDSLVADTQNLTTLTSLAWILKAYRIVEYKDRFSGRSKRNLIRNYDPQIQFSRLGSVQLDSVADHYLEKAGEIARLREADIQRQSSAGRSGDYLLWLSSDPSVFLFNPTLPDIVLTERIALQKDISPSPSIIDDWLSLSQMACMDRLIDSTGKTGSIRATLYSLYGEWIQLHKGDVVGADFFIETLARKYLYSRLPDEQVHSTPPYGGAYDIQKKESGRQGYPRKETVYGQYLQNLLLSPFKTVRAQGVYQLCLLWNKQAERYNPSAVNHDRYLYNILRRSPRDIKQPSLDTLYRWHYRKADSLFQKNEALMSGFPLMNKVLLKMRGIMETRGYRVQTYENALPGDSLRMLLQYRNMDRLYIKIVRIDPFDETFSYDRKAILEENDRLPLLKAPAYREFIRVLPLPADYQWRNIALKIDPLPSGNYLLLYSDTTITPESDPNRVSYINTRFTNMAAINNDRRVFILDRKTGLPLEGVTVIPLDRKRSIVNGKAVNHQQNFPAQKTAGDGSVTLAANDIDYIKLIKGDDSLITDFHEARTNLPEDVYDKDGDDDLVEYYTERTKLLLFTDRAIYRPGQTVFYKGIFLIPDPRSGKQLVLNWQNLRLPFFKKLWLRLQVKYNRKKIELYINDPFDRAADTLRVIPNKYGSFAGRFVLPKNAATGEWEFHSDDLSLEYDQKGRFSVEEYKRPEFEVKIEKPVGELSFGDPFAVTIRLKSFSGAVLAQTPVHYTIEAMGSLPAKSNDADATAEIYEHRSLSSGTIYTDEHGQYRLPVHDSALDTRNLPDGRKWEMRYEIKAEAVDATGESQEDELTVNLSSRPVRISVSLENVIEKKDLVPVYIQTRSEYGGVSNKQVSLTLYKISSVRDREIDPLDRDGQSASPEPLAEKELIVQSSVLTGGDSAFHWPLNLLTAGHYRLELVCKENERTRGMLVKEFSLFDKTAGVLPDNDEFFNYLRFNEGERGSKVHWISGNGTRDVFSIYHVTYYAKTKTGTVLKNEYIPRFEKTGIHEWNYTIPMNAIDEVRITRLCILHNELYKEEKNVYIPLESNAPGIILERYRKNLLPGGPETFVLSVKTKNENTAAELMTTMYDATLDKLQNHSWPSPNARARIYPETRWNGVINSLADADWAGRPQYLLDISNIENSLEGRVAGVSIINGDGMDQVVVTALGIKRSAFTGSAVSIQIRGSKSLTGYGDGLVILDGVPYVGDPAKIDPNTIVQGVVLKGADAAALYGSRASNGVLVLSTKGPVQLPVPEEAPVTVRRNFSETAFFYPQLHAGKNGYYTVSFTLPESVTEWKWKMLAHTKKADFAYEERTLFSSLPLMVQPNMPRYLFQGDTTLLVSRIANLDSNDAKGTVRCRIEDAVTGEEVSSQLLVPGQTESQSFSVSSHGSSSAGFRIAIPTGLLHPLKIKITASSKNYSDGEEHLLPILARKMLVTQAQPIPDIHAGQKISPWITTPRLPDDAEPYGIGLFITPKPQAALINSLPYLAECPYDCSEQTFNKMLAHLLAIQLVKTDTAIQKELINLQHSPETSEKNGGAATSSGEPGTPDDMTMPWLRLEHLASLQQTSLLKLLDTARGREQLDHYLKLLYQRQSVDGGLPWFQGGYSSEYISNYLLAGFGKIKKEKLPLFSKQSNASSTSGNPEYQNFIGDLIRYCDQERMGVTDNRGNFYSGDWQNYFYARSYWTREYPVAAPLKRRIDSLLEIYWAKQESLPVGRQALLIAATLRYTAEGGDGVYLRLRQRAFEQLESIRQLSISDPVNGMRWKEMSDPDDLSTETEEWVVRTAEAFEESEQPVQGIVQWLLQTRQDHRWSTTKSTADAVSLLGRQGRRLSLKSDAVSLRLNTTGDSAAGNVNLRVSDGLLSRQGFAFNRVDGRFPSSLGLVVEKDAQPGSADVSGSAGVNYYYFSADPAAGETTAQAPVRLLKALYRLNDVSGQWDSVTSFTRLKVGDKIRTVLTIDAKRFLQYVFIEDRHAAALESGRVNSGYEYTGSFSYYRSVRDWGLQFFAEKIPSGLSTISYETVVDREGSFLSGPASLQCMYQPTIKAYSHSGNIRITK